MVSYRVQDVTPSGLSALRGAAQAGVSYELTQQAMEDAERKRQRDEEDSKRSDAYLSLAEQEQDLALAKFLKQKEDERRKLARDEEVRRLSGPLLGSGASDQQPMTGPPAPWDSQMGPPSPDATVPSELEAKFGAIRKLYESGGITLNDALDAERMLAAQTEAAARKRLAEQFVEQLKREMAPGSGLGGSAYWSPQGAMGLELELDGKPGEDPVSDWPQIALKQLSEGADPMVVMAQHEQVKRAVDEHAGRTSRRMAKIAELETLFTQTPNLSPTAHNMAFSVLQKGRRGEYELDEAGEAQMKSDFDHALLGESSVDLGDGIRAYVPTRALLQVRTKLGRMSAGAQAAASSPQAMQADYDKRLAETAIEMFTSAKANAEPITPEEARSQAAQLLGPRPTAPVRSFKSLGERQKVQVLQALGQAQSKQDVGAMLQRAGINPNSLPKEYQDAIRAKFEPPKPEFKGPVDTTPPSGTDEAAQPSAPTYAAEVISALQGSETPDEAADKIAEVVGKVGGDLNEAGEWLKRLFSDPDMMGKYAPTPLARKAKKAAGFGILTLLRLAEKMLPESAPIRNPDLPPEAY